MFRVAVFRWQCARGRRICTLFPRSNWPEPQAGSVDLHDVLTPLTQYVEWLWILAIRATVAIDDKAEGPCPFE